MSLFGVGTVFDLKGMSYTHFGRSLDEIIDLEDWDTELLNAHFAVQQIMENFSGNLIKVQFINFFKILICILLI